MIDMTMSKEKYVLLIGVTVLSFIYVLATEVLDRWQETAQTYAEVQDKYVKLLTPDQLRTKRSALLAENEALTATLAKTMTAYSQDHSGVFEYLNSNAKKNGIRFESLTPKEAIDNGQLKEFAFKVDFDAGYHQTGKFVNAIETGPVPVSIVKMDIASDPQKSSTVHVSTEGKAYMLSTANHENQQ